MKFKSLLIGFVLGAAVASGVWIVFGDQLLGRVRETTQDVGRTVEHAGETLQQQGEKLH